MCDYITMKNLRCNIIFCFITTVSFFANAQSNCENLDAELQNTTNWICREGRNTSGGVQLGNPVPADPGRHNVVSQGTAPNVSCASLPRVYRGNYSFMVGNNGSGKQAESMEIELLIDSSNAIIVMAVAAVMENPGHNEADQPRVRVEVLDQNGQLIGDTCGNYQIVAGYDSDFQSCGSIQYLPWKEFAIDFSNSIGTTVTIKIITADCTKGGHYGYAYFEARCIPLTIKTKFCQNANSGTICGPDGFANYAWSNGSTDTCIFIPADSIGVEYRVTMTTSTNCQVTAKTTLTPQEFEPDFTYKANCNGEVIFQDASTVNEGTISEWLWNFGDGTSSTEQNPVKQYSQLNQQDVALIITSSYGCSDDTTITIEFPFIPEASFSSSGIFCSGNIIKFADQTTVPGGQITSWQWNFGDGTTANNPNPLHSFAVPGTYNVSLVVTNEIGCVDSFSSTFIIHEDPTAIFSAETVCHSFPTLFINTSTDPQGTIAFSFWDLDDGSVSTLRQPTYTYETPGTYSVTLGVVNNFGCMDSVTSIVTVLPNPVITIDSPSYTIYLGQEVELNPNSDFTIDYYRWDSTQYTRLSCYDCPAPLASPFYTTSYTVIGYDAYGCADTLHIEIIIRPDKIFFIPNVFTPNGDGVNDVFKIYSLGYQFGKYGDFKMAIFDRWGAEIFVSQDINFGWDGTHNGKKLNPDVYVYEVYIEFLDNTSKRESGSITLLK